MIMEHYVPTAFNYSYQWFTGDKTAKCYRLDLGPPDVPRNVRSKNYQDEKNNKLLKLIKLKFSLQETKNYCDSTQDLREFFNCSDITNRKFWLLGILAALVFLTLIICSIAAFFINPFKKRKKRKHKKPIDYKTFWTSQKQNMTNKHEEPMDYKTLDYKTTPFTIGSTTQPKSAVQGYQSTGFTTQSTTNQSTGL